MSMRVWKEECNVIFHIARENKVITRHSAEIAALCKKAGFLSAPLQIITDLTQALASI